ncbi:MAG: Gfo/Idh/MocA family oxidoreductase [archaeon]|nr:Gfo/Idh/MocA family oxidoreductase [archaeon]
MTKSPKLKLGIIGGGINSAIGLTHKIALRMDGRFDLIAGCFSRNNNTNSQTAEKWCVYKLYSDYNDLLESEKNRLDAVVVLTPTNKHMGIVSDALKLNIPVVCEKTVTDNLTDALALKKLLKKTKGFLLVTYNYTGYPMVRELKHMIQEEKLGKIIQIKSQMPQEGFMRLTGDGSIPIPQNWRLQDGSVSTISLDLGTHLSSMTTFLVNENPLEVVSMKNSFGHHNVTDNISCMVKYSGNIDCQMWYSKSALGHKNGLNIEVYGVKGSAMWHQMNPELLIFNDNFGRTINLDRSSKGINIANKKRYERFKSGHPAGFIEAFANYYDDVYNSLSAFNKGKSYKNDYVFTIDSSIEGLALMEAIEKSVTFKRWEKI